ncbi:MAG TPA: c-type cytochrome biogenesis protein CcmI, partial [Chromatiales bacterium]|nr:c-type cytochrome biogenesis protein CcmI [Chromatiales bacterium]
LFWMLVAAMVMLAAAFVLLPALRTPRADSTDPTRLNAAVIRQQLQELERDLADGRLSQADYESAKADLERELVYATDGLPNPATGSGTAGRSHWLVAGAALTVPALALVLYHQLGASRIIPLLQAETQQTSSSATQASGGLPSVEEMVARLEEKLRANPDNAEGWVMLGRSYTVMNRYAEAAQAYEKANTLLEGRNADVLAAYAEALSLAQQGQTSDQIRQLTQKALALDPTQPRALWLKGFDAFQQGDYSTAVEFWELLAAQVDPNSEDHANLQQAIQIAKAKISGGQVPTASAQATAAEREQPAAAANARLSVLVDLSDKLRAQVEGDETVFIFARAAQGPRMPLAIVRKRVSDLPATIVLDDSMAMTPQMRLSAFDRVRIEARVSKSGTARPQSGDLEGEAGPVAPTRTDPVPLTIDRVVP